MSKPTAKPTSTTSHTFPGFYIEEITTADGQEFRWRRNPVANDGINPNSRKLMLMSTEAQLDALDHLEGLMAASVTPVTWKESISGAWVDVPKATAMRDVEFILSDLDSDSVRTFIESQNADFGKGYFHAELGNYNV